MPASLLPAKRQVPSARPHHSPEGGQPPRYAAPLVLLLEVVADYKRLNAMKRGLRGGNLPGATVELTTRRPMAMLHAGLDLSRHRLDVCLLDAQGSTVQVTAAPPDADGLRGLARQTAAHGQPVRAATWVDERRPLRP
jgi:hypothetical protein